MDINDFRAFHTVLMLAAFVGIWIWAWSRKRNKAFDEAANLPFADESAHAASVKESDHE